MRQWWTILVPQIGDIVDNCAGATLHAASQNIFAEFLRFVLAIKNSAMFLRAI